MSLDSVGRKMFTGLICTSHELSHGVLPFNGLERALRRVQTDAGSVPLRLFSVVSSCGLLALSSALLSVFKSCVYLHCLGCVYRHCLQLFSVVSSCGLLALSSALLFISYLWFIGTTFGSSVSSISVVYWHCRTLRTLPRSFMGKP